MPSIFWIWYQGYKGVVIPDLTIKGKTLIKFKKLIKKFSRGSDYSFSIVNYLEVFLSVFFLAINSYLYCLTSSHLI